LTLAALSGRPCDWLMVFTGNSEAELLHIESGKAIPLSGSSIRRHNLADSSLIYLVEDGRKTELRRIVLDPATESYELLASLDTLNTTLTWIDDARGAVYLRSGQLRRIDPNTGKEILLPGVEIQTFQRIP